MIFLGTGASEMIPNPMCGCDVCRRAQTSSDLRERRMRTSFLLDEENLIDCGADVTSSCVRKGVSLQKLRNIFLTHTHLDYFSTVTLENLQMCITEPPKLNIFMSQQAYDGIHRLGNVLVEQEYTNYPENAKRWLSWEANYLNLEHLFETIDCLVEQDTVDDDSGIYHTHIGHKGGLLHVELNEVVQHRYGGHICVAYDGLRI